MSEYKYEPVTLEPLEAWIDELRYAQGSITDCNMPLNESRRKPRREKWPLEFDLEGVPRDGTIRKQLLETLKGNPMAEPRNSFLSDKLSDNLGLTPAQKARLMDELLKENQGGREIDLSKPVLPRYQRQEFPQMAYHKDGRVRRIEDAEQLEATQKDGFKPEPHPAYDYSTIRSGRALTKKASVQQVHRQNALARRKQDAMSQNEVERAQEELGVEG
jgi:hypothetical protein